MVAGPEADLLKNSQNFDKLGAVFGETFRSPERFAGVSFEVCFQALSRCRLVEIDFRLIRLCPISELGGKPAFGKILQDEVPTRQQFVPFRHWQIPTAAVCLKERSPSGAQERRG
jgi:hypothetical protein